MDRRQSDKLGSVHTPPPQFHHENKKEGSVCEMWYNFKLPKCDIIVNNKNSSFTPTHWHWVENPRRKHLTSDASGWRLARPTKHTDWTPEHQQVTGPYNLVYHLIKDFRGSLHRLLSFSGCNLMLINQQLVIKLQLIEILFEMWHKTVIC